MKTMKKLVSILLAFLLACVGIPMVALGIKPTNQKTNQIKVKSNEK